MSNSFRIRTEVGKDKSIKVQLEQDFESLEILSLKILQSQIYTRVCSDYGVVVGRVTANNGYGIPNAKVSIFIPLSEDDENNAELYKDYYKLNNDDGDGDGDMDNKNMKLMMPDDVFLRVLFYSLGGLSIYIALKLMANMYKKRD